MKKIVGIIAAVAMAASVFAVEFSGGMRLEGSLFGYGADGSLSALNLKAVNQDYHRPFVFSVNGDEAGAQLKICEGDNATENTSAWNIWFKPADAFKIYLGAYDTNLFTESIDWTGSLTQVSGFGYGFQVAADALNWDVIVGNGNGGTWMTKAKDGDAVINDFYTRVTFGGDFGNAGAFLYANNTFKNMKFGAGYKGNADSVGYFFNFIGFVADKEFAKIRAEADVTANFDSVGWQLFVDGGYNLNAKAAGVTAMAGTDSWRLSGDANAAEKAFVGFVTKFSIPVDAFGFYVYIKDNDVLAKDFNMTFKPGFTTSVGACAIEVAVDVTLAKKVAFSVPVNFAVSF